MTDPKLHAAEVAAGAAAARKMIAAKVPAWELHMIPAGAIEAVIEAVITAVDGVRDGTPPSPPPSQSPPP
jgi:negative regulator of sigma E activity